MDAVHLGDVLVAPTRDDSKPTLLQYIGRGSLSSTWHRFHTLVFYGYLGTGVMTYPLGLAWMLRRYTMGKVNLQGK